MMPQKIAVVRTLASLLLFLALYSGTTNAEVEKVELKGVDNFSQIQGTTSFAGTRVGFGGATEAEAIASLKNQGFVTVVNLRLTGEENIDLRGNAEAAKPVGLNYIHLPFDTSAPAEDIVEKFIRTVGNARNQPVYVHCGSATRAAALWMVGRVLVDGWNIEDASAEAAQIARKPPQAIAFARKYIDSLEE
jgi:uncharacterized protein (TIGR01244 family)